MSAHPHPLVSKPDVLREIFGHLGDTPRSLADSARACQAFFPHAVDVLWEKLDDPVPLLKTLGESLVEDKNEDGRGVYVLDGYISEEQWQRFHSYARRVRILTVVEENLTIHPSVYSELTFRARRQPVFSALVHLSWESVHPFGTHLLAFISSSLHRVEIIYGPPYSMRERPAMKDRTLGRALCTLSSEAPFVYQLHLDASIFHSESLYAISHFTRLRELRIASAVSASEVVRCCGSLEELVNLQLFNFTGAEVNDAPFVGGFDNLEELWVTGSSTTLAKLLRAVTSPRLRMAGICFTPEGGNWNDWRKCLALLSSQFAGSLRQLGLRFHNNDESDLHLMDFIHPLLDIHGLREVELEVEHPPAELTDSDVHDLASAWRDIEKLTVELRSNSMPMSPSALSLVEFARYCPRLVCLEFNPLNVLLPLPPPSPSCPLPSLASLEDLSIPYHLIPDTNEEQIARFLDSIFPNLDLRLCRYPGAVEEDHNSEFPAMSRLRAAWKSQS
ncbi:hypothetical protein BKA93DRAFT_826290 [Sparassis latifolia]